MLERRTLLSSLAALPVAGATLAAVSAMTPNDRRLGIMADRLDVLQEHADKHAAAAGSDPDDPYTQAVAEIDLVAVGMAALPADTMTGVLLKVRAMTVPIVASDDEAHALALSVCRDLSRFHARGDLANV